MKNKTILGIIIALVVIGMVCGIVYKYFTNSSEISNKLPLYPLPQ